MLQANFVKINLRIAVSVLVSKPLRVTMYCVTHYSLTRRRQTAETAALKFPVYLTNRVTLSRRETGSEEGGGLRPFSAL